jgi:hypothetical protein
MFGAALVAERAGAKLATFDAGLAKAHPRESHFIPELIMPEE